MTKEILHSSNAPSVESEGSTEGVREKVAQNVQDLTKKSGPFEACKIILPVRVPLGKIFIHLEDFQGRDSEYSEETVIRIIHDVRTGKFIWEVFDPVRLYEENEELLLLMGHSRYEAFRRIVETFDKNWLIQTYGHDFTTIPSIILRKITRNEAKTIARFSNSLNTPETDTERVGYYRQMRIHHSKLEEIREIAERTEGRSAAYILALSYLDPEGKMLSFLRVSRGIDGYRTFQQWAEWIGKIRAHFGELGKVHENEIFDFLSDSDGGIKNYESLFARLEMLLIDIREKHQGVIPMDRKLGIDRVQLTYAEDETRKRLKLLQNKNRALSRDRKKKENELAIIITRPSERPISKTHQDIKDNPEIYIRECLQTIDTTMFNNTCEIKKLQRLLGHLEERVLDQCEFDF